jgi:hypothetical protein
MKPCADIERLVVYDKASMFQNCGKFGKTIAETGPTVAWPRSATPMKEMLQGYYRERSGQKGLP